MNRFLVALTVVLAGCGTPSYLREALPPAPKAGELRLVSLNLAHGRGPGFLRNQLLVPDSAFAPNLRVVAEFLDAMGADVVCLQEVDFDCDWSGAFDHLAFLKENTGYAFAAGGINNRNGGWYRLNYGNGTLSRYPIRERSCHPFGDAELGEKGFLFTEVVIDQRTLPVINIHLSHLGSQTRREQLDLLEAFIAERSADADEPFLPLVMGDMNAELDEEGDAADALLVFLRTLDSGYTAVPGEATFPSGTPWSAIDLVYVPSAYEVVSAGVVPDARVSDHLPLVVDLRWVGPGGR